jgi:hypothetical protein
VTVVVVVGLATVVVRGGVGFLVVLVVLAGRVVDAAAFAG